MAEVSNLLVKDKPETRKSSGSSLDEPQNKRVNKHKKYLELSDVVKKYGEFTALNGLSLTIFDGEFISFLGPSGCGKTTLLRAIAGLDLQTSGLVIQNGKDVSDEPSNKRDFGIVFQSYALFPNLTVRDNVAYGLENRKMPKKVIASKVEELLEMVGLPGSESKYPAQLSGGQQQRVALARALATSPGLLLLDEPLSALDAQVRVYLRKEIKALQNKLGVTTIMVTHDQEEALTMADRIVVMNHGVIEQVGTPEQIYQQPANAFVAGFIGTTNLLSCQLLSTSSLSTAGVNLACECRVDMVGQKALMAIRPEDIRVSDDSNAGVNSLDVTVDDIEYLGAFSRVLVSHKDGLKLKTEFSMNVMRDLSIKVGKVITVTLPVEHIRLFPEERSL
ncbi:putative 2-aminoethylphosphonate ABC transporter ATP-binding protein [Marinobacter psychrophilus]|uniref:putative 2-aminoethylphosphonate ABC transporter ATP-binding protein n=1 Tax=Marinobacter psychrophilus TaxID=330734 RepID=UPI0023531DEE|nr:putative 2-aminoethylphosphonate ABC transporter ATP-binding protein [Marinobacter psychrophilus]